MCMCMFKCVCVHVCACACLSVCACVYVVARITTQKLNHIIAESGICLGGTTLLESQ